MQPSFRPSLEVLEDRRLLAGLLEPNNTAAQAFYVGRGGTLHWNNLAIESSGDEDWLRFRIDSTGLAGNTVGIDFTHALGDLDIELYDSQVGFLDRSIGIVNNERISLAGQPAGSYYLRVFGANGAVNPAYSFQLAGPPQIGDFFEPNETAAQAFRLPPTSVALDGLSIHSTTDVDYYRIDLTQTGTSTTLVQLSSSVSGNLDMALYDSNGAPLGSSTGATSSETLRLENRPAGTYYVQVFGRSGATNSSYVLEYRAPAATPPQVSPPHNYQLRDLRRRVVGGRTVLDVLDLHGRALFTLGPFRRGLVKAISLDVTGDLVEDIICVLPADRQGASGNRPVRPPTTYVYNGSDGSPLPRSVLGPRVSIKDAAKLCLEEKMEFLETIVTPWDTYITTRQRTEGLAYPGIRVDQAIWSRLFLRYAEMNARCDCIMLHRRSTYRNVPLAPAERIALETGPDEADIAKATLDWMGTLAEFAGEQYDAVANQSHRTLRRLWRVKTTQLGLPESVSRRIPKPLVRATRGLVVFAGVLGIPVKTAGLVRAYVKDEMAFGRNTYAFVGGLIGGISLEVAGTAMLAALSPAGYLKFAAGVGISEVGGAIGEQAGALLWDLMQLNVPRLPEYPHC